ncbi:ATP-binding cassette transporter [Dorcoceras hygrometricum]|uniref:ATP-binding cassette transporter n=1 Tax=Dorcoceras hygrometricum TaxID=472368 RepID=A0A2Z7C488_9LAMI|nr:ATP-binding cassette transporter [Dorcoceras hygrometricum]
MTSAVTSSFSRKLQYLADEDSADEAKRERRSDVVLRFSRWISADDVIGDVIIFSRCRKIQCPVARIPGAKNRRSSKAQQLKNESAAKQLTTYEVLSKMDVNC